VLTPLGFGARTNKQRNIPAGLMYEVWAQDSPYSQDMDLVHIANVVVSACTQYALPSTRLP
jgi:hypothetical protein